jgi:hypothetical protein
MKLTYRTIPAVLVLLCPLLALNGQEAKTNRQNTAKKWCAAPLAAIGIVVLRLRKAAARLGTFLVNLSAPWPNFRMA